MIEQAFPGFALSSIVGALLLYLIVPRPVVTIFDRGRQFAGWTVAITTLTTLFRYFQPPPKGGGEAIAVWLVVSISSGLVALAIGSVFQLGLVAAKKVRKDGPEMLGTAIKKSTDIAQRVQVAVKTNLPGAQENHILCGKCQSLAKLGAIFCSNCGNPLPKSQTCIGCGSQLTSDQNFCDKCGLVVEKANKNNEICLENPQKQQE